MTKKQLDNLVLQSYTKDSLDAKKVSAIAGLLTRFQLKQYLRELKNYEKQKTVNVIVSYLPTNTQQKTISHLFPGKRIKYEIDKNLLVGIKIINNDEVFDLNLKDTLDNLLSFVSSSYD